MSDKQLRELESIKKLIVASLLKSGMSTEELGSILGVTGRTIRNMIPIKKIKKINTQP